MVQIDAFTCLRKTGQGRILYCPEFRRVVVDFKGSYFVFREAAFVVPADVGVDLAHGEVHFGQAPGGEIAFLAVDGDVAQAAAMLDDELFRLHEHAAGSAAGVVDAALVGFEHVDEHADHGRGLFTALAEVYMAGRLGARVDLSALPVAAGDAPGAAHAAGPLASGAKLFSESQSRFVATVTPDNRAAFEALFGLSPAAGPAIAAARIGEITSAPDLDIRDGATALFSATLDEMFHRWRRPLDW